MFSINEYNLLNRIQEEMEKGKGTGREGFKLCINLTTYSKYSTGITIILKGYNAAFTCHC